MDGLSRRRLPPAQGAALVLLALGLAVSGRVGAGEPATPGAVADTFTPTTVWTEDLRARIRAEAASCRWDRPEFQARLNAAVLKDSLEKARGYLLAAQRPEGNFVYAYDFVGKRSAGGDNQVRQAGAVWDVALLHQERPSPETRAAVERGLDFFIRNSRRTPEGGLQILYPLENGSIEPTTDTGAVALAALSIIEFLRTEADLPPERRAALKEHLDGYITFLKNQQFPDGTFSAAYLNVETAGRPRRVLQRSCYFDGEALLAFCKAARYMGHGDLMPRIQAAAARIIDSYVLLPLQLEPDPPEPREVFQWATMAFWEMYEAGWPNRDSCADAAMIMSSWMIHGYGILDPRCNNSAAYEGLIPAYHIAEARGEQAPLADLRYVIDIGMRDLLTCQVGGVLRNENRFLTRNPTQDPQAIGGVMMGPADPNLRIDVTGHLAQAMQLALKWVYR